MKKTEHLKLVGALGGRIRMLRKTRKMSQEQLAELAGLHPTYIGDIERGRVNASINCYAEIARALGLPLHELINLQPYDDMMLQNEMVIILGAVAKLDEKRRNAFIESAKSLLHTIESI